MNSAAMPAYDYVRPNVYFEGCVPNCIRLYDCRLFRESAVNM